jgi:gamma-butyrobetaine dioxygenase
MRVSNRSLPESVSMPRINFASARPSGSQALDVDFSDGSQVQYSLMWLLDTKKYGLTIVHGVDGKGDASMAIAQRIGFLRETNFGQTFEVIDKADPNNLAYTSLALHLHTDLTNQETPPGYQFLHCITNDAHGGGSVFADGFAMAQVLRDSDPQAFDVLAGTLIPSRFFDRECDIRIHRPVITLDHAGAIQEIRFNAHLVDLIDLPPASVDARYRAYRAFMRLTRDPAFRLSFRMASGDMTAFDNRRILHGREAFNPAAGNRHLHGCYVDRVDFDSRMRMLSP